MGLPLRGPRPEKSSDEGKTHVYQKGGRRSGGGVEQWRKEGLGAKRSEGPSMCFLQEIWHWKGRPVSRSIPDGVNRTNGFRGWSVYRQGWDTSPPPSPQPNQLFLPAWAGEKGSNFQSFLSAIEILLLKSWEEGLIFWNFFYLFITLEGRMITGSIIDLRV